MCWKSSGYEVASRPAQMGSLQHLYRVRSVDLAAESRRVPATRKSTSEESFSMRGGDRRGRDSASSCGMTWRLRSSRAPPLGQAAGVQNGQVEGPVVAHGSLAKVWPRLWSIEPMFSAASNSRNKNKPLPDPSSRGLRCISSITIILSPIPRPNKSPSSSL